MRVAASKYERSRRVSTRFRVWDDWFNGKRDEADPGRLVIGLEQVGDLVCCVLVGECSPKCTHDPRGVTV
jgi:hypothetical protein